MKKDNIKSRRSFLSFVGSHAEMPSEETDMVKMLTSDGKLVWVKKSVLNKKSSPRTTNKEILEWTKTNKPL